MRLVVALVLLAAPLAAQVPYDACSDRADHHVPGIVRNDLGYGALATFEDGHPVIYWNQRSMEGLSRAYQLYLYIHECAHIRLRHIYHGESAGSEQQADCWALQLLIDGGILDGSQTGDLESDLRRVRGDATHDPGDVVLRRAAECRSARTDPRLWAAVLDSLSAASADSFRAIRGDRIREITSRVVFETTLGAPGVFDCDLGPGAVYRCLLFASRSEKATAGAYRKTAKTFRKWLPEGWTAAERDGAAEGIEKELDLQDGRAGTTFTLALTTGSQLWFVARPAGP